MANVVGTKGQVVISKEIRDRLGVQQGWLALQRLEGDHVEVHFIPPRHNKSMLGSLKPYVKKSLRPGKDWERAREKAWEEAVREKFAKGGSGK